MRARAMVMVVIAVVCCAAAGGSALAEWPPPTSNISLEGVRADFDGEAGCFAARSVQIHWEWTYANDGYPPYAMTIAGWAVDAEAESVSYSCWRILWLAMHSTLGDGVRLEDGVAYLPMRVIDRVGGEAIAEVAIPVVPPPPTASPQAPPTEVSMVVGATDLFLLVERYPHIAKTETLGVYVVPLARYRPVGVSDWDYFVPVPGFPQSDSFSLARHVTGLQTGVLYELQAAYVWYTVIPHSTIYGREVLDLDASQWWRESNDPAKARWSRTWRFQPIGAESLTAEATADAVTVSWTWAEEYGSLDGLVGIHLPGHDVIVRSDEWPNVVWGDGRNNIYGAMLADLRSGPLHFSSTISGLPPDTEFEVSVQRVLPSYWPEAPTASIVVRTEHALGDEIGVADPRDITLEPVDGRLVVRWTPREAVYDQVVMQRCRLMPSGEHRCVRLSWNDPGAIEELEPQDGRAGLSFGPLALGDTYRLYFNRRPPYRDRDQSPFMCVAWEISVPLVDRDVYLDRLLGSSYAGSEVVIAPVSIPPLDWYVYRECAAGDTSGP